MRLLSPEMVVHQHRAFQKSVGRVRDDPHATVTESWFEGVQRADLLGAKAPALWRSREQRVSKGDRADGGVA
jgi:hypothetical protein